MFRTITMATLLAVIHQASSVYNKGDTGQARQRECQSPLSLKIEIQTGPIIRVHLIESSHEFLFSSERNSGNGTSCFYQGRVEFDNGIAMANQRDGKISGTFYYANRVYEIPEQPAPDSGIPDVPPITSKLMQPSSGKRTCALNSTSAKQSTMRSDRLHRLEQGGRAIIKLDSNSDFSEASRKYIKLILIGDQYFYASQGNDETRARNRLWEVANYINALYKQLGVNVITVHTEVWDVDPYTLPNARNPRGIDPKILLDLFMKYRMKNMASKPQHSAAHLISSLKFGGTDVGLANMEKLCSFEYGGGVNSDQEPNAYGVASTVAHELAHNLGLNHDESEANCARCPDKQGCVMATVGTDVNPVQFSACSVTRFLDVVSRGIGYCMTDPPQDSDIAATKASCGNKIVESGEDCDCGPEAWCKNKCCNPKICKFTAGSSCASGECCDLNTCTLKLKGTLCRAQRSVCDLPESCDGISEWCPRFDDYKVDGTECLPGKAYCYKGRCNDRDTRCSDLYDGADVKAAPAAWSVGTTQGNQQGYCSYTETNINPIAYSYTACTPENQRCGVLYCVGKKAYACETKWKGDVNTFSFSDTIMSVYIAGVGFSLVNLKYSGYRDPGLVPDGAECGVNMMCVDSQCVSTVSKITCPNCNGHGACTQSGLCFCDAGFAPPDCQKPGLGGSSTNVRSPGETITDGTKTDKNNPRDNQDEHNKKEGSKSGLRSATPSNWGSSVFQMQLLLILLLQLVLSTIIPI